MSIRLGNPIQKLWLSLICFIDLYRATHMSPYLDDHAWLSPDCSRQPSGGSEEVVADHHSICKNNYSCQIGSRQWPWCTWWQSYHHDIVRALFVVLVWSYLTGTPLPHGVIVWLSCSWDGGRKKGSNTVLKLSFTVCHMLSHVICVWRRQEDLTDCSNCGYHKETENNSIDMLQDKIKEVKKEPSQS